MAAPIGQQLVDWAMKLQGKPYVFGTEQDGKSVDKIAAEDCSEMVQNGCDQLGVSPKMPDGAINQWHHCQGAGLEIDLEDAYSTPGALLFRISDKGNHVAICRGIKGKADSRRIDDEDHWLTIEARGAAYGVGCWEADRPGFMSACLIPGVSYGPEWD